ncbi:glycoside hydrolase family 88/105 protein [Paenibacillus endoradicis]|uniref:glycoside hydrolase family 88/105 protein n=1 Tax=Paenibacillus endoradicis TaxID=2972487 RepID=UPI002159A3AD|nr:glycoside hydrolase family 88 protein [Paenibacillus endoradicis]MCR8657375.1 glycoside hydrolase family 88 protein [Paenibacillus endoradicis]
MERQLNWSPLDWAESACQSLMKDYIPEELPPAHRWHYHQGVFLCGMEQVLSLTGKEGYEQYIKRYVDQLIDEEGNLYFARDELDAIQPGLLLFRLAEQYPKDGRYEKAAQKLRYLFETLNKTSEGGFWHKDKYPYNMWLDGLYMGGVFALKYANAFAEPELRDMVLLQEQLMRRHMRDEKTGLLYHAWDESKQMVWANEETGCSPEFWARSLGWYGLAISQFLDELPVTDSRVKEWETVLLQFVEALLPYQDRATGLWYQVVDKGDQPDNWLETSGTCLFVYAIAKAYQRELVGEVLLDAASRGYQGLLDTIEFDERFILPKICIGTSAGDYQNYVTRPTSENDLHGVGAFILASVEMEKIQSHISK